MLRRGLDRLYGLAAALAAASLLGIFLVMIAQVVLRELSIQFPGADDISAYLCVATTFFALAHTFRRGELIRVGLLINTLAPGPRRVAELLALSLALIGCAYALYWTIDDVLFSYEIEDRAQGALPVLLWVPKLSMPIGIALLLIAVADELFTVLRGGRPNYAIEAEARMAQGDYSS